MPSREDARGRSPGVNSWQTGLHKLSPPLHNLGKMRLARIGVTRWGDLGLLACGRGRLGHLRVQLLDRLRLHLGAPDRAPFFGVEDRKAEHEQRAEPADAAGDDVPRLRRLGDAREALLV